VYVELSDWFRGEAWNGMAFRFSLFIFKEFLGSDSILGECPVANSLFYRK
jgi:hypothetical protein